MLTMFVWIEFIMPRLMALLFATISVTARDLGGQKINNIAIEMLRKQFFLSILHFRFY